MAGGLFHRDLGISYSYSQPVWELIAPKVGITLCLSLFSFALIAVVSIPLGLWASRGHSRWETPWGRCWTSCAWRCRRFSPASSLPISSALCCICSSRRVPAGGVGHYIGYLFFPALAVALPRIAMTVKLLRTSILDEAQRDYVRTSMSRGRSRSVFSTAMCEKHARAGPDLPRHDGRRPARRQRRHPSRCSPFPVSGGCC